MNASARSAQNRFVNAKNFFEHLKLALEFYDSPNLLNELSPLAKPYFLHDQVYREERSTSSADTHWGEVLREKIDDALSKLWGGPLPIDSDSLVREATEESSGQTNKYRYLVLELNYIKKIFNPPPKNQATIYNDILHIGRTTHDRHLKDAVEELGNILLKIVRPTLRLESPIVHSVAIGREHFVHRCMHALADNQSVTLTGTGGIGKTVTGSLIAAEWPSRSVFWFTIRRNFNDQLRNLLFALGYFLHQQKPSSLWLQLIADKGEIKDLTLLVALLLADVEGLSHKPLLIIDEADILRSSHSNPESPSHLQILGFLEQIQNKIALVLIGQQPTITTALTLSLDRFSAKEIGEWFRELEIPSTDEERQQVADYTEGNPRLISLLISLYRIMNSEEPTALSEAIVRLPDSPGLVPIWDRLRRRLTITELRLLQLVSVFRTVMPIDGLEMHTAAETEPENILYVAEDVIAQLFRKQLLHDDSVGGIYLLPALQTIIYQETSAELRELLHQQAAHMCAMRGEYTETAYHLASAGLWEQAVNFWHPHLDNEVHRGQADIALSIFHEISMSKLSNGAQKKLAFIRGKLFQLVGKPEQAIAEFEQVDWHPADDFSIIALKIWGQSLDDVGDQYNAIHKFDEGIDEASNLLRHISHLHTQKGHVYLRSRELSNAQHEVKRARYFVEMLEAAILFETGRYAEAQVNSAAALEIAEELNVTFLKGRARYYLAIAQMHQNKLADAFENYKIALDDFRNNGQPLEAAQLRSNLAGNHLVAGNYEICIEEAKQALQFFEKMKAPYWSALNSHNISEAYFELGELDKSEEFAMKTMSYEESRFFPYGLFTLGAIRYKQDNLEEAQKYFEQSCQIAEENEDRFLLAHAQRGLGEVFTGLDQNLSAIEQIQSARQLFEQMEIEPEISKTQALLDQIEG